LEICPTETFQVSNISNIATIYNNEDPLFSADGSTPIPVSNIQRGKPPSQAPGVNGAAAAGVVTKMKDPRPYQLRPMLDSVGKGV
jgi:hypothetical protein